MYILHQTRKHSIQDERNRQWYCDCWFRNVSPILHLLAQGHPITLSKQRKTPRFPDRATTHISRELWIRCSRGPQQRRTRQSRRYLVNWVWLRSLDPIRVRLDCWYPCSCPWPTESSHTYYSVDTPHSDRRTSKFSSRKRQRQKLSSMIGIGRTYLYKVGVIISLATRLVCWLFPFFPVIVLYSQNFHQVIIESWSYETANSRWGLCWPSTLTSRFLIYMLSLLY